MKNSKTLIGHILVFIASLGLWSCAGSDTQRTTQTIDEAREALSRNDYSRAVELCNELISSSDTSTFSSRQYFDLAIIYAVVADSEEENGVNMAQATYCLSRSVAISPDSLDTFKSELPVERQSALSTVEALIVNRGADMSNFIDPEDPTAVIDHDIDPDNNHTHE